jgi:hypothetical protein
MTDQSQRVPALSTDDIEALGRPVSTESTGGFIEYVDGEWKAITHELSAVEQRVLAYLKRFEPGSHTIGAAPDAVDAIADEPYGDKDAPQPADARPDVRVGGVTMTSDAFFALHGYRFEDGDPNEGDEPNETREDTSTPSEGTDLG